SETPNFTWPPTAHHGATTWQNSEGLVDVLNIATDGASAVGRVMAAVTSGLFSEIAHASTTVRPMLTPPLTRPPRPNRALTPKSSPWNTSDNLPKFEACVTTFWTRPNLSGLTS